MRGFLLIDKPSGITSNDVVSKIRGILEMGQVGHAGTLDRLATGLLGVMVGDCTRLARYLHLGTHEYRFNITFGRRTDTLDEDGEVVEECDWEHVDEQRLREAIRDFTGDIEQVPPDYSAVKIDGKRASDLAREGVDFELEARPQTIDWIEIESFDPPRATLSAKCTAGTYVRSLARDLGEALDSCASTTAIRRLATGSFRIEDAVPLDELTRERGEAAMLSPLQMVRDLPGMTLDERQTERIGHGNRLPVPEVAGSSEGTAEQPPSVAVGDFVALEDPSGQLAAVCEIIEGRESLVLQPRTVLTAS